MKLSIIVPAYNEEKSVITVLKKLHELDIPKVEKEIIIIDDGSTDQTVSIIKRYISTAKNKHVHFIEHVSNQGKGAAVISGMKKASGDYIVIQDADSEYNPQDILRLLKPIIEEESNVVYGTRLDRLPNFSQEEKEPLFILHYLGNRSLSFITSILYRQWITDMETCYKIFPRSIIHTIRLVSRGFEFEPEITAKLLKKGYKIKEIPITTKPRSYKEGKKLRAIKDGPKALWTLIKYRIID